MPSCTSWPRSALPVRLLCLLSPAERRVVPMCLIRQPVVVTRATRGNGKRPLRLARNIPRGIPQSCLPCVISSHSPTGTISGLSIHRARVRTVREKYLVRNADRHTCSQSETTNGDHFRLFTLHCIARFSRSAMQFALAFACAVASALRYGLRCVPAMASHAAWESFKTVHPCTSG